MQNSRARIVNPLFDKLMTGMCYLAWIKYTKNLTGANHRLIFLERKNGRIDPF